VDAIAQQLDPLVDEECRLQLLLNLANVESLASAMLGRFLTLHHKVLAAGGRLKFCGLSPAVQEVFATARLPVLFGFYPGEEEALRTFGPEPLTLPRAPCRRQPRAGPAGPSHAEAPEGIMRAAAPAVLPREGR